MEGLKDATAWWSGGMAGPGQALAARSAEREGQSAELFNMRNAIAQNAMQQKQIESQRAQDISSGWGGAGAPGQAVAGQMPLPADIVQQYNSIFQNEGRDAANKFRSNYLLKRAEKMTDPNMLKAEVEVYDRTRPAGKRYTKVAAAEYYNNPDRYSLTPEGEKQITTLKQDLSAPTGGANAPLSVRNNNPGNIKDPKTGELMVFKTPEEGQRALEQDLELKVSGQSPAIKGRFGDTKGFLSPAMLAETWSPSTAPGNSAESTTNYAKHIAAKLGIEPTAQIPNTPEAKAAIAQAIKEFESGAYSKAPAQVAVPAPTQPVVSGGAATPTQPVVSGGTTAPTQPVVSGGAQQPVLPHTQPLPKIGAPTQAPLNTTQAPAAPTLAQPKDLTPIEEQQRLKISEASGVAEGQKQGELLAGAEDDVRTKGRTAGERQVRHDATIKLLDDPQLKDMVGKFQTGTKGDTFINQVEAGIMAGNFGNIGLNDLRKNLSKEGAPIEAIRKFEQLDSFLKQNELEWRTNYLKGQGSVSNMEADTVKQAIGSINDPIGKLKTLAASMRERALFDAEVYQGLRRYREQYGRNASMGEYLDSDQFDVLSARHNTRLATVLNMDPSKLKANNGYQIPNIDTQNQRATASGNTYSR